MDFFALVFERVDILCVAIVEIVCDVDDEVDVSVSNSFESAFGKNKT